MSNHTLSPRYLRYDPQNLLDSDSDSSADEFLAEIRKRKHANTNQNICEEKHAISTKQSNDAAPKPPLLIETNENEQIISQEKPIKKRKKRSRHAKKQSQVRDVFVRLSKPREVPKESENPIPVRKSSNWKRLYDMSVEKPPVVEEPPAEDLSGTTKSNSISRRIARDRMVAHIDSLCESFAGQTLTSAELSEKLLEIGILGTGQTITSTSDINHCFSECVVDRRPCEEGEELIYSGDLVSLVIRGAVLADHPTRRDNVVRASILANATKRTEPQQDPPSEPTKVSQEALERLSSPKHRNKRRKWTRKCDPMIWGYKKPPDPPSMSAKTKDILSRMGQAQIPFEERDRLFILLKEGELDVIRWWQIEEQRQWIIETHSVDRTPKFKQAKNRIDTEVQGNPPEQEKSPTRPETDGEPRARQVWKRNMYPSGWDASINRHRMAYIRRKNRNKEDGNLSTNAE